MLIKRRALFSTFKKFAEGFDANFNDEFKYPLFIFHEADFSSSDLKAIQSMTRSNVVFYQVNFTVPSFINQTSTGNFFAFRHYGFGYRHMCRFHSKLIYELPVVKNLEYVWRLDDDSQILKPIKYDVFKFMRCHNFKYGYVWVVTDEPWIEGLEEGVMRHWKGLIPHPTFAVNLPMIVFNNFEISATSLWMSDGYRRYIELVDKLGGIYYHRWGDAPIKALAVRLLLRDTETHRFTDICYGHDQNVTKSGCQ